MKDLRTRLHELERGQIVVLHWLDSCSRHMWISHDEVDRWARGIGKVEHRSCGFFFTVTNEAVIVVQSMVEYEDGAEPNANACMSIPLVAIRRLAVLTGRRR